MTPSAQATPSLGELQRAAAWQRDSFTMHWDRCRTRLAGRFCLACDQLDRAAFAAERAHLEASHDA